MVSFLLSATQRRNIKNSPGQAGSFLVRSRSQPGRVGNKANASLDIGLETLDGFIEELLLVRVGVAKDVDGLLSTAGSELNRNREIVAANLLLDSITTSDTGQVDEGWFHNVLLALLSLQESFSEAETSERHGESRGTCTILRLDDLIATELDTVDESIELIFWNVDGRLGLAEERNDGGARVTPDNWYGELGWVLLASDFANEGLSTDISRVVTPKSFLGSKTPAFLRTSAAMGTVELTGLEMTRM